MTLNKMGEFTFSHSNQQDDLYKVMTALEIKQAFDSRGDELKTVLNALIDALQSQTGNSGAKQITALKLDGITWSDVQSLLNELQSEIDAFETTNGAKSIGTLPITGVTGTNVQDMLASLKGLINQTSLGQIPDGSITDVKLSDEPTEIKQRFESHKEEKATNASLGHVIVNGTTIIADENGVIGVTNDVAKFKKGSSTYTDRDNSQTFTDSFCTSSSLVTIVITSVTNPQGVWTVASADGSFTITSTASETADIAFDYFIQKAVG